MDRRFVRRCGSAKEVAEGTAARLVQCHLHQGRGGASETTGNGKTVRGRQRCRGDRKVSGSAQRYQRGFLAPWWPAAHRATPRSTIAPNFTAISFSIIATN